MSNPDLTADFRFITIQRSKGKRQRRCRIPCLPFGGLSPEFFHSTAASSTKWLRCPTPSLNLMPRAGKVLEFLESTPGPRNNLPIPSHTVAIPGGSQNMLPCQAGVAHLGRGASSPSRCSSCSGPPRSASPGRGGARCALRRAASCSCGSARWLPCRTGPRACPGEGKRRTEAGKNGNTPRGKPMLPTYLPGDITEL